MQLFYREPNGDYLLADHSTASYYAKIGKPGLVEGRATAIAGDATSVCTTSMSRGFLRKCRRVRRANVPDRWRLQLVGQ